MCTVSHVYDRRYSAHLRSLSLAAADINETRVGPSSIYVSDLWSLTDANGTLPMSRRLCRSIARRMGYASLHDMFQPIWLFWNLPEFAATLVVHVAARAIVCLARLTRTEWSHSTSPSLMHL